MATTTDNDALAAQAIADFIRTRQAERAANVFCQRLGSRILGFLRRHRVPEADAEELVSDVCMKLLGSPCPAEVRPVVWLWTVVNSVLVDWARKRGAQKRGGAGEDALEVRVDEETQDVLIESQIAPDTPPWLKLCVERAAHELQVQDPNRAHVLYLSFHGHSAAEVAVVFGAKPPPTKQQETAARNRVLEAMKKARDFFSHCKEN